jgi:glycosyltransferase involved in cell wall biosynthesis
MRVLIFFPTYNENGNVLNLYNEIKKVSDEYHILVIDDESNDGTIEKLKYLASIDKNFIYLARDYKMGLGSAHTMAYEYAIVNDYQKLVTLDADLSHNPQDIPRFVSMLSDDKFVIGSRWLSENEQSAYFGKRSRRIMSKMANIISKTILGDSLTEYTTSFRGFDIEVLKKIVDYTMPNDYSFFVYQVHLLKVLNIERLEIPIIFKDRILESSKIPKNQIVLTVILLSKIFIYRVLKRNWIFINR